MNDGTAFPFVMLGLGLMGLDDKSWNLQHWLLKDLLWAISVAIIIGVLSGYIVTKITNYVKVVRNSFYLEDFLTISSISLSYGLALQCDSYGFLAVFANALTIRQLELRQAANKTEVTDLPDDALSFNEQLERIFEVVSVTIVGLLINFQTFSWSCLFVAFTIILIIRPISVFIGTLKASLSLKDKAFLSWFGVRGIGSIYYLFFAINHSQTTIDSTSLLKFTLWTIFFSIFIHGVSVKLILKRYDQ